MLQTLLNLVSKSPNPSSVFCKTGRIFKDFYNQKIGLRPSFVLCPVSGHFIREQLNSLNPWKAVGLDDVSSRFLHDGADSIISPITHIVNLFITQEMVPTAFKDAKLCLYLRKDRG